MRREVRSWLSKFFPCPANDAIQKNSLIELAVVFRVHQTHWVLSTIETAWSNSGGLVFNSSEHLSVPALPPPSPPPLSLFLGHSYGQPHLEISSKVYIWGSLWLEGPLPPAKVFSVTFPERIQERMIYPEFWGWLTAFRFVPKMTVFLFVKQTLV